MRLHVRIFAAKCGLDAVNCQLLCLLYNLAATIVTATGLSFRIFIGQHTSHCLHYLQRSKILRSNEFNTVTLPFQFLADEIKDQSILLHVLKIWRKNTASAGNCFFLFSRLV
mgnify:CR=1 FL=1